MLMNPAPSWCAGVAVQARCLAEMAPCSFPDDDGEAAPKITRTLERGWPGSRLIGSSIGLRLSPPPEP
jgi:hypothetical protein